MVGAAPFSDLTYQGTWQTIDTQHQLVTLSSGQRLLDLAPNGDARLWQLADFTQPRPERGDPLRGDPLTTCNWPTITPEHELLRLGSGVLDWVRRDGSYRWWTVNEDARGTADPLPGNPFMQGYWLTIGERVLQMIEFETHLLPWGSSSVLE